MSPCNVLRFFLLSLTISSSVVIAIDPPSRSSSCHPDQRDALSRFNHSFSISAPFEELRFCMNASRPKTDSWRESEDCCSWEGVACDNSTGDIVGLDLSCAMLSGAIDSNSSLFSLRHLRSLSLAGNDLIGSSIPPEISVFLQMTHLNLSSSSLLGIVPAEISRLSKLVSLDLSGNLLEMQNPTMRMLIMNLTQLEELDLSHVNMSGVIPTSMMNFSSSLISLHLSLCGLEGRFPDYIFQLPHLRKLDLSKNFYLHGTLPESNRSSSLAFLSLQDCYFTGEVRTLISSLPRLTYLDLSWNSFTGHADFHTFSTLENLRFLGLSGLPISGEDATDANHTFPKLEMLVILQGSLSNFPCFLSSMPELKELILSTSIIREFPGQCINNGLSFPQLQRLEMSYCKLTKVPSFLSRSNKLRFLDLSENMIEDIPSWFWGIGVDTLKELNLRDNLIRGGLHLPWKRLTRLHVQNNWFEGPLPIPPAPSILNFLASQNRFNGSIPLSICQITSLASLDLDQNNLTGILPPCLGNLTELWRLDLSRNSLTGAMPPSLVNCTSMTMLDVSFNFLGQCRGDIFLRSTSLISIDLSSNKFEGPLPYPSYASYYYYVSNNHFSGQMISSLICNATNLRVLDLSNNGLTGTLPQCLNNITISLLYLNLQVNKFHGSILKFFPEGCALTCLDFSRNQFKGSLPRSLSNCLLLEALNVGNNMIVDSFPDWLGDLPLKVLSLRSNKFYGQVSISQGTRLFSKLRILDLSNNGFEGNLSDNLISEMSGMARGDGGNAIGYMTANGSFEYYSVMIDLKGVETEMVKIYINFATLDMSSNHFWGELPRKIGLLISLKSLNFSHNSFMGTIPPSLGNLTNLESLDLSSNHLVGEIPKELVKLTSLGALDLSWNNLVGPIPSGGHFNTFTNSFEGILGLCGIPLTRVCGHGRAEAQPMPDQRDNGKDELGGWFDWTFVAIGFGCGVGIGISLGYMALEIGRPLCLARMVIRLEGSCRKRSKRKAPRRNSRT